MNSLRLLYWKKEQRASRKDGPFAVLNYFLETNKLRVKPNKIMTLTINSKQTMSFQESARKIAGIRKIAPDQFYENLAESMT